MNHAQIVANLSENFVANLVNSLPVQDTQNANISNEMQLALPALWMVAKSSNAHGAEVSSGDAATILNVSLRSLIKSKKLHVHSVTGHSLPKKKRKMAALATTAQIKRVDIKNNICDAYLGRARLLIKVFLCSTAKE